jgi:hypothetical protein
MALVQRNFDEQAKPEASYGVVTLPLKRFPRLSPMSEREMEAKLVELDRLLNDPEVRMDPHRVWLLLQEISGATRTVEQIAA